MKPIIVRNKGSITVNYPHSCSYFTFGRSSSDMMLNCSACGFQTVKWVAIRGSWWKCPSAVRWMQMGSGYLAGLEGAALTKGWRHTTRVKYNSEPCEMGQRQTEQTRGNTVSHQCFRWNHSNTNQAAILFWVGHLHWYYLILGQLVSGSTKFFIYAGSFPDLFLNTYFLIKTCAH